MLANLSKIACQRLGLKKKVTDFIIEFFRISKCFIKTVHGVSEDFNSDALHPLFGALQGSGAGPAVFFSD